MINKIKREIITDTIIVLATLVVVLSLVFNSGCCPSNIQMLPDVRTEEGRECLEKAQADYLECIKTCDDFRHNDLKMRCFCGCEKLLNQSYILCRDKDMESASSDKWPKVIE